MIERTKEICARFFFTATFGVTLFFALCFFYFGVVKALG